MVQDAEMNVLLTRPVSFRMPIIIPPVGLGYLATALRKSGCRVTILDCAKEKYDYSYFESYIAGSNFDVIGLQLFTADFDSVKKMLGIIKRVNKKIVTIVGGAHPSCTPKTILDELPNTDYAFHGEAEKGIVELVNHILLKKDKANLSHISGLIFRDDIKDEGTQHATPGQKTIINHPYYEDNLDALGLPAWDLIPPNLYPNTPHGVVARRFPIAPIFITRGCPFPCTFCGAKTIAGRKLRWRNINNVIQEIKLLYDKYSVREIHIEDDNFTLNRDIVKNFCESLIASGLNIPWACPNGVRLDTLDLELLRLMKRSGCYSFAVGIESGSPRILRHMKKKLSLELIKEKIDLCSQVGIKTTGFFIVGYPIETREDILKTLKFAKKIRIDRAEFANFLPLPGTEAYDYLVTNNQLENKNWENFLPNRYVVYSPPGVSFKELRKLQQKAFFEFYLRPRIIFGILREIKSLKHFWYILKRWLDTVV